MTVRSDGNWSRWATPIQDKGKAQFIHTGCVFRADPLLVEIRAGGKRHEVLIQHQETNNLIAIKMIEGKVETLSYIIRTLKSLGVKP